VYKHKAKHVRNISKATGTVAYLLCCLFKPNIGKKSTLYCSRSVLNEKRYKIRYTLVQLEKWNLDLGPRSTQSWSWTTTIDGLTSMTQRHCTSPNYTDHPKWIYAEYTVLKIFSLFRIFEQLALALKNRAFPEIFTVLSIFLTIQDFWANLRLQWNTEFALKFFTVFNILFTLRIFEQLAFVLNSLYWIYIFYSDVRWGSWLGRHCLFQSQICECMNWM